MGKRFCSWEAGTYMSEHKRSGKSEQRFTVRRSPCRRCGEMNVIRLLKLVVLANKTQMAATSVGRTRAGVSKCGARLETLFAGPHAATYVEILKGCIKSLMIEIGDVKKDEARKGDARTSTTQTSMNSAGKPNKSKNFSTQYRLSGQALP